MTAFASRDILALHVIFANLAPTNPPAARVPVPTALPTQPCKNGAALTSQTVHAMVDMQVSSPKVLRTHVSYAQKVSTKTPHKTFALTAGPTCTHPLPAPKQTIVCVHQDTL